MKKFKKKIVKWKTKKIIIWKKRWESFDFACFFFIPILQLNQVHIPQEKEKRNISDRKRKKKHINVHFKLTISGILPNSLFPCSYLHHFDQRNLLLHNKVFILFQHFSTTTSRNISHTQKPLLFSMNLHETSHRVPSICFPSQNHKSSVILFYFTCFCFTMLVSPAGVAASCSWSSFKSCFQISRGPLKKV